MKERGAGFHFLGFSCAAAFSEQCRLEATLGIQSDREERCVTLPVKILSEGKPTARWRFALLGNQLPGPSGESRLFCADGTYSDFEDSTGSRVTAKHRGGPISLIVSLAQCRTSRKDMERFG